MMVSFDMELFRCMMPTAALDLRKGFFAIPAAALLLSLQGSTRSVVPAPSFNSVVQIADSNWCGEAAWTVVDTKNHATLFTGKASCTTVEDNGVLHSIMVSVKGSL